MPNYRKMTEADKAMLIKKLDNIITLCDVVKVLIETYDQRDNDQELNRQRANLAIEASTFNVAIFPVIRPESFKAKK